MRWNCPHCGVALAVSDDKLGGGWTFSRCYKCGGFALVRKAEVSLIKVDKAPQGEKILLPESHEVPALSNSAVRNLSEIIKNNGAPKPTILPSTRKNHSPLAPKPVAATPTVATPPPFQGGIVSKALPPPLPEGDAGPKSNLQRVLPYAVTLTGLMAIASGFYLFKQGQNLALRARIPVPVAAPGDSIPSGESIAVEESRGTLNDQVSTPPMAAPTREEPAAAPAARAAESASAAPSVSRSPAVEIARQEEAQTKSEDAEPRPLPGLVVRPKSAMVMLRTGPGTEFKELGYANPNLQYIVTEWKERWFKVLIKDSRQTAWVRNDLVTLTPITSSDH